MSEKKLTPWFEKNVKPAHVGIYERNYGSASSCYNFDYWDGNQWIYVYDGKTPSKHVGGNNLKWRGLARRPR